MLKLFTFYFLLITNFQNQKQEKKQLISQIKIGYNYYLKENGFLEKGEINGHSKDQIISLRNRKSIFVVNSFFGPESGNWFNKTLKSHGFKSGRILDYQIGINILIFLAENSNVEYGLSIFSSQKTNTTFSIITTSYDYDKSKGNCHIEEEIMNKDTSYILIDSWHSHPLNKNLRRDGPSGYKNDCQINPNEIGDRHFLYDTLQKFKSDSGVFRSANSFHLYDPNSKTIYRFNLHRCFIESYKGAILETKDRETRVFNKSF